MLLNHILLLKHIMPINHVTLYGDILLDNDWLGIGLYLGYIVAFGLPAILLKVGFNVPFEVLRKMYHMVIALSIFPLVTFFDN